VFPISNTHQIGLYQSYHTYDWPSHNAALSKLQASQAPFMNIEGPFDEQPGVDYQNVIKVTEYAAKFPVCGYAYGGHYVWQFLNGWQNHLNTKGFQGFIKIARN
jgi:hypothetical protein